MSNIPSAHSCASKKIERIEELNAFHRSKVLAEARAWRLENHCKILAMMRCYYSEKGTVVAPQEPTGAAIFFPERWDACNWLWFSFLLMSKGYKAL